MLESPIDTRAAEKALVRTYAHPSYRDPWNAVTDYERVTQLAADQPSLSPGDLSTETDTLRGRLQQ